MEKKRNYVGLMSVKRSDLKPLFDSKNENEKTEVVGLINSLAVKQISPIVTCNIEDRDGIFILDGVQRWKYMQYSDFMKCYHLGVLCYDEAVENWFALNNRIKENILKMLDIVNSLSVNQRQEISRISAYSLADLEDILKVANFDFFAYIEKHQKEEPVQQSLFD
jgi:hypothetical protein